MNAAPMKHRVKLTAKPNPKFAEAAAAIADGSSPEWLLCGLEHFSSFVGGEPISTDEAKHYRGKITRMHDAADLLIRQLPLFQHLPPSLLECPDDVAVALDVLPRIREALAIVALSPRRKRPNVPHKFCAAVVFEAWTLIHGRPEPIPDQLRLACQEYWGACGGGDGGIENWRRHVEEAAATDNALIRKVLSAYASR